MLSTSTLGRLILDVRRSKASVRVVRLEQTIGVLRLPRLMQFVDAVPDPHVRISSKTEVAMKYKIVMHRTDEGISVSVPALPGCWSEGDTEEEALANIQDAIRDYLAALEDRFRDAEVREIEVQV